MVLRFSGPTHQERSVTATQLPARARELLAGDDLRGYRQLFDQIAAIDDPHRRYWAGVGLVEAGLAARTSTTAARSPALLRLAGLALLELWSLDAAEALLEAARRLDPELPGAERHLRELTARRREGHGLARRAPLRAA